MVRTASKNHLNIQNAFRPSLAYARLVAVKSAALIGRSVALVLVMLALSAPSHASGAPVLSFMQRIADAAMSANDNRSKIEFEKIIRENVDIEGVGTYSLGSYIDKVSFDQKDTYFDGVINFMSRYAAMKSKDYKIESVKFRKPKKVGRDTIIIRSRIKLASGAKYSIKWKLTHKNGGYKIRDASLYGFWVMPYQRRLFRSFVRENNNDVNALIVVLAQ